MYRFGRYAWVNMCVVCDTYKDQSTFIEFGKSVHDSI